MDIDGVRTYTNIAPQPKTAQSSPYTTKGSDIAILDQQDTTAGSLTQAVQSTNEAINNRNFAAFRKDKSDEKKAQQEAEASDKMLKTAIEVANTSLKLSHRMLQSSIHEKTRRIMVKVIDTDTDEVVREIPPEKTLDLFAKVLEMAGILFDEKK